MKISFVSNHAVSKALSYQLTRLQNDMMKAQQEISSGKYADVGLALGARTGQVVALDRDIERLQGLQVSNGLVSARIDVTTTALKRLTTQADALMSALNVGGNGNTIEVLRAAGKTALETLTGALNSSHNGEYIFSGINTDVEPITDYFSPGADNKAAFDQAFQDHFGFPQTDPQAQDITAAEMTTFLEDVIEPMFLGNVPGGWQDNWSKATDQGVTNRIGLNETAETTLSANMQGVRKLAMASTIVADLLDGVLNSGARDAVISHARNLVGESVADINQSTAQLGLVDKRIDDANERIKMQVDIFKMSLGNLQNVDTYEASTRVNNLLAQIETSYALTARIQRLSLLNYL
ncbi:flagellar hook-associated family protein [Mesorhizobium sp. 1B3]|uniref:flagellar hook-associated family protein n=1 Tax=Mesorhizobium sp. 1B3 TaxID=3243599 RepID=UPI003D954290